MVAGLRVLGSLYWAVPRCWRDAIELMTGIDKTSKCAVLATIAEKNSTRLIASSAGTTFGRVRVYTGQHVVSFRRRGHTSFCTCDEVVCIILDKYPIMAVWHAQIFTHSYEIVCQHVCCLGWMNTHTHLSGDQLRCVWRFDQSVAFRWRSKSWNFRQFVENWECDNALCC